MVALQELSRGMVLLPSAGPWWLRPKALLVCDSLRRDYLLPTLEVGPRRRLSLLAPLLLLHVPLQLAKLLLQLRVDRAVAHAFSPLFCHRSWRRRIHDHRDLLEGLSLAGNLFNRGPENPQTCPGYPGLRYHCKPERNNQATKDVF